MSKPPAFQFYPTAFLTSEDVATMTDKEFRAYVNLLAQAWLSEPVGSIPDDDHKLGILSRIGLKAWLKAAPRVRKKFESRDGRLFNSKLSTQFETLLNLKAKRVDSGRQGAEKRWGKDEENKEMVDNQRTENGKTIVLPSRLPMAKGMANDSSLSLSLPSSKDKDYPSVSLLKDKRETPSLPKPKVSKGDPPVYWPEVIAHMKKTWERKKPDAVFEFGGKEAKLLQSKVRAYMAWGIMALWDKFLDSDDKWYRNTGYSISTFVSSSGIGRLVDDYSWKKDAVKYEEKLNGPMVNLSLEGVVKGLRPIDCSDLRCTEKLAYCAPCQRRKNSMVESPGLAQVPANKYS